MAHPKLLALLAFGILSACVITSASVLGNATGFGYELLMTKMDYLEYKFLELQVESKAQTQALLQNQNLNQRELASKISEVAEQQKTFVSQENIMNAIFELKPRKHPADNSNLLSFLAIQNSTLHLPTIKSCAEEPSKKSGRYWMTTANNHTFEVYCEQTFYGGGWIAIQNRFNGSVSFYKNWTDYKNGFGSLDGEFWLGLDRVHQLTSTRTRELLVHLEDHDGLVKYARFLELQVEFKEQTEALLRNQNTNKRELANQISELLEQQKLFVNQEKIVNAMFQLKPRKHPSDNSNLRKFLAIQHSAPNSPAIASCLEEPSKKSGRYWLTTVSSSHTFEVYCEQTFYGGGWIVVQNRFNGSVDFARNWNDYRNGFGSLDGEFWLGLDRIHQLTSTRTRELLVHLEDHDGLVKYARYAKFAIGSEDESFLLKTVESYTGTAGDSLTDQRDMKFSTPDKDNDSDSNRSCGSIYSSGWWFNKCFSSNLNGLYQKGNDVKTMTWYNFHNKYSGLKLSKMMIR